MKTIITKSKKFFNPDTVEMYFKDIRSYPVLTKEQEDNAAMRHDTDLLVKCNLRFAIRLAHAVEYYGDLADLIQCANLGLMKAAEVYDPSKMNGRGRFIHFAKSYILGEMMRYNRKIQSHFSCEDFYLSIRIKAIRERFITQFGEEPDYEYIAEVLGVTETKVSDIINNDNQIISTDSCVDDTSSTTFGEMLSGDFDADTALFQSDRRKRVEAELHARLNPKEEIVVRGLFGFDSEVPTSLEDIATKLKLTTQRCRQLQASAITKLKNNKFFCDLISA